MYQAYQRQASSGVKTVGWWQTALPSSTSGIRLFFKYHSHPHRDHHHGSWDYHWTLEIIIYKAYTTKIWRSILPFYFPLSLVCSENFSVPPNNLRFEPNLVDIICCTCQNFLISTWWYWSRILQVSEFYSDPETKVLNLRFCQTCLTLLNGKVSELYILDIRQEDEGIYYCRSAFSFNMWRNNSTFEGNNHIAAFMELKHRWISFGGS